MSTGIFQTIPGSLEGKWFAESADDAEKWGALFARFSGVPHDRIVAVEVDAQRAAAYFRVASLDGIGPGRFATLNELPRVMVREVIQ